MAETGAQIGERVWEHVFGGNNWILALVALIIGGLLKGAAESLFNNVRQTIVPRLRTLFDSSRRMNRALGAVAADSPGIWLAKTIPQVKPEGYDNWFRTSIPIIVVANLKGGVGKTTTAANLMAHYAIRKNKKVLGIDLDFQGSLTKSALSEDEYRSLLQQQSDGGLSKAAHLINDRDAFWLQNCVDGINEIPRAKLVSSYYSLSNVENRVMVEWLLDQRKDDVRYHLARILHDPTTQRDYQYIIIDAPPRLTTACVQALCAATHVLIPTVLDELSAEAVGAFANQLRINQKLWPQLKILGALGTMTALNTGRAGADASNRLKDYEVDALVAVRDALVDALQTAEMPLRDATPLPEICFIPNKDNLSREAGNRIAYAHPSQSAAFCELREAFDRLGDEIDLRVGRAAT